MRYTPAQVKEALEIGEETLRHWRAALSPLKDKRGYSPCFSPGDLLALKVVTHFRGLGLNVRQLTPHAERLFAVCQGAWFGLEDKVLVFDGAAMEVVTAGEEGGWANQSRIAIPLGQLLQQLRQHLSGEQVLSAQPEITFPPLEVAQGRAK